MIFRWRLGRFLSGEAPKGAGPRAAPQVPSEGNVPSHCRGASLTTWVSRAAGQRHSRRAHVRGGERRPARLPSSGSFPGACSRCCRRPRLFNKVRGGAKTRIRQVAAWHSDRFATVRTRRTMRKFEDCWVVDRTMFEYVNQVRVCARIALVSDGEQRATDEVEAIDREAAVAAESRTPSWTLRRSAKSAPTGVRPIAAYRTRCSLS